MDFLQCLMDSLSHVIFTLGRDGIIAHTNQQAKMRFDLYHSSQHLHPAGRLEPGDLVLIVNTAIGADDGVLRLEDLAHIGIRKSRLRVSDRLVATGVFDIPGRWPVYKSLSDRDADSLCLETVCEGILIRLSTERHNVTATVRGTVYAIGYSHYIEQMVVLSEVISRVRFWQEKGYSARREGTGYLFRGDSHNGKWAGLPLQVKGYHLRDFLERAQFERDLIRMLNGQAPRLEDREYEINGFELVATLPPMPRAESRRPGGVIIKFRNIKDIYVTILERNDAIETAERAHREITRRGALQEASFAERFGLDTLPIPVRHQVCRLSQLDCSTLITGKNGTGKSFLAQAIRQAQPHRGPFVMVGCVTISPTLPESEMFGYVRGAFTGANLQGKVGLLEVADGDTIFLDEIDEILLRIQAKLLSVIQDKVVCRVGSTRPVPVGVRILAAINRDLRAEVAAGHFRQDLYYRLSAFSVELPPLCSCPENVCFFTGWPMEKIPQRYGVPPRSLSGEAFGKLPAYNQSDNIRELENVLEDVVTLSESKLIYAEYIHLESTAPAPLTLKEWLKREERRILRQVLAQCGGSHVKIMELLGLSKIVFYGKPKEY